MKTLITLSLLLTAFMAQAQDNFLTVINPDEWDSELMYPPFTKFELRNEANELVFSDQSANRTFKIDGNYTLKVYPSWRENADVFKLKSGRLELRDAIRVKSNPKKKYKGYSSHGITVEKELSPSQKHYGLQNVKLTFSDGVVFTYTDGDYMATLNGKQLEISDKYLIYSILGIHKVSYNPSNGKVYWVFEPLN